MFLACIILMFSFIYVGTLELNTSVEKLFTEYDYGLY